MRAETDAISARTAVFDAAIPHRVIHIPIIPRVRGGSPETILLTAVCALSTGIINVI